MTQQQKHTPIHGFHLLFIRLCRVGAVVGLFLLGVNIAGCLLGNRIYFSPDQSPNRPVIALQDYSLLQMKADESPYDYASRMNSLIFFSMHHYFTIGMDFDDIHKKAVPFLYNWALWARAFGSYALGGNYSIEFASAESALARGYGYCSQQAQALENLLNRNGINAKATNINGHVITRVTLDGKEIIFDPDFNIIMPFSLEHAAAHPALVTQAYSNSPVSSPKLDNRLADIYGQNFSEDNHASLSISKEREYHIIKWAFPITLLLFWGIMEVLRRKHRRAYCGFLKRL
ncbi:MAG: hypothetical protein FWG17_01560 [Desulfovibrionaceae bacterium]|nr:hypothetical protein [Desulfovibrionaceae bacterium]